MAKRMSIWSDVITDWKATQEAVSTVFLPRQLPECANKETSSNYFWFGDSNVFNDFATINKTVLPDKIFEMLNTWNSCFRLASTNVLSSLENLDAGSTFPIHLPAQNAALTITNNDNENFTVRGYNVQPETSVVMEATGPLIAQQPCTSLCVPKHYILDEALVDQLTALQTYVFEGAMAKTQFRHTVVNENREARSPRFMFEWLFGVLSIVSEDNNTAPTIGIIKKVRDRVKFQPKHTSDSVPWRRHPTWLAFKFVLHGTLVNENGYEMGTIIYKTAMLNFLTSFLKIDEHIDQPDLCHQMMAKVACRVHKLDVLLKQYTRDINCKIRAVACKAMENSTGNLTELSILRNGTWKQLIKTIDGRRQLPELSTASPEASVELKLASCSDAIQARLSPVAQPEPAKFGRMEKHASGADVDNLNGSTRQGSIVGLYQWEEMVFNWWLSDSHHRFDKPRNVYDMLEAYNSASSRHYNRSDPIGQSRRLLTSTVLIALCDVATTSNQPLLLQHKPSVEVAFLQGVLATDHLQLQVAKSLEDYFQRRNTAATMDGPLDPTVHDYCLSSHYAANNPTMMAHLKSILEKDERECEAHKVRIKGLLADVARDEKRLRDMTCDYTTTTEEKFNEYSQKWTTFTTKRHSTWCQKCELDSNLSNRTGPIFERCLPEWGDKRQAVVFELLLPEDIQNWRDSIWYYTATFLRALENSGHGSGSCKLWIDYLPHHTAVRPVATLGSTNVSFLDGHYSKPKLRYSSVEGFIKPCNLNCYLTAMKSVLKEISCDNQQLRQKCTFRVRVSSLRQFVTNTSRDQSEIIAKQGESPRTFNKREFITYGSVRCGERLQWYSILRGIHDRSLLLHRLEVVQLICQCVWQAGSNKLCTVLRESHHPASDSAFVQEMASELKGILLSIRGNWQQHWALCAIVVLANRLLNLHTEECNSSEENVRALQGVLATCRHIAVEWLDQMQLLLDSPKCDDATDLQLCASRVAAFGALTYDNGTTLANQDSQPLKHWLRFITDMHSNTVLNKSRPTEFLENLFDCVLRVSVKQHSSLCELLDDEDHVKELWEFVSGFYCRGEINSKINFHTENQLWVCFTWLTGHGQKANVQIDLREGQCWIDGLPLGRLPTSITTSPIFTRHFGHSVFRVLPCTGPHGQRAQASGVISNSGPFVFSEVNSSGKAEVTIFETHSTKRNLLLICPSQFSKMDMPDIPAHFLDQYSLWIDLKSHEIFFRPISFREPEFVDLSGCNYILDFDTRCMSVCEGATVGVQPKSSLVELSSGFGSTLVTIFKKLELPKCMEIWQRPDGQIYILLPRLNLTFYAVGGENELVIYSVDHNGWCVDNDQTIGTLIGLQHGLILVKYPATDYTQRCLLLPHASVSLRTMVNGTHPGVTLQLNKLRNPALFRYTLNSNLKQLQAPTSHAAWFFLAYLHGVTSSMQPDPFTSMTGTEMAMTILQSARSWSSSPYDADSKHWLECIACLSPQRQYYPKHKKVMEIVVWPQGLTSLCASDAYIILTKKLLHYSNQLNFLFPHCSMSDEEEEDGGYSTGRRTSFSSATDLNTIEYLRSFQSYPILARLTEANSPPVCIGKTAFSQVSASNIVQNTSNCVLYGEGTSNYLTAEEIESAFFRRLPGTDVFNFVDLDVGALKDCGSWSSIDLQTSFMSFQARLEDLRQSSRQFHLALMLSFLSYVNNQHPELLSLAIALCSTDVEVVPPCTRSFPNSRHSIPSYLSIFRESFVISSNKHAKNHGLRDLPSWETESSVIQSHAAESQALLNQYNEKARQVKRQLHDIQLVMENHLCDGPIGYDQYRPDLPEISFDDLTADIINKPKCAEFIMRHFQRSNLSLILLEYSKRLSEAMLKVLLYKQISFAGINVIDFKPRHASYTVDYACKVEKRSPVFTHLDALFKTRLSQHRLTAQGTKAEKKLKVLETALKECKDPISQDFAHDLEQSRNAMEVCGQDLVSVAINLEKHRKSLQADMHMCKRDEIHSSKLLADMMSCDTLAFRALSACGLLHRTSELAVLPVILGRHENTPGFIQYSFGPEMCTVIGGTAVQLVRKQRCARLLRLLAEEQWDWFSRETSYIPHTDWPPCDHVEWLLFEVENDVTIWPKQVHVAEKMMSNEGKEHIVVQLNMGEGKTSVILPVIAAELADGQSLVRVVVLTSLYTTNYQQLVFKLGGMLGHRVCSLPFRRDFSFNQQHAEKMLSFLNGCRYRRDVMVTVREYLLSLLLKYEESCCKPDLSSLAASLHQIVAMMQNHARDVLDEADEILHHRFQLIYPIGVPCNPDGGDVRWIVSEVILEAVKANASEFAEQYASCVSYTQHEHHAFPHLRLLESKGYLEAHQWLCERVIDFILAGKGLILKSELMDDLQSLQNSDRSTLKTFWLCPHLSEAQVKWLPKAIPEKIIPSVLCIRGLLANGVLLLCLKKRFRVEYGLPLMSVGSKTEGKASQERVIRMAVPFRAKDVASERTEFGHTDVAVLLTLLSYYQHGLSTQEVNVLLDRLHRKEAKRDVYNSWVAAAGVQCVDSSIQELDGINRKDAAQMKQLVVPFLKYHTAAINFYLNHVIFPSESKDFKSKLEANSWSMTPAERCLKVTGFSGTNDTRHLLPGSTKQDDLPQLQHTNAYVCNHVLAEENNTYCVFKYKQLTGKRILDDIAAMVTQINTIIDAGALVLDLTNKKLAQAWLAKRPDKQGVVYFDNKNQLRVLTRQQRGACKLELSSFADNLSECLVYLDHAHCRGTDLRMAMGTVAAVTLGKGLRRDELMQACMRMRRLGKGHTLTFWAPLEVDRLIRQQCDVKDKHTPQNQHVVHWCFLNSISATRDGFYAWATQGLTHLRVSDSLYGKTEVFRGTASESWADLGEQFLLPDCMTLEEMYGQVRTKQSVPEIIQQRSRGVKDAQSLIERCTQFVSGVQRFAQALDEEQEREMEQEIEEERQIQRPPVIKHIRERCPQSLLDLASSGNFPSGIYVVNEWMPLWKCLKSTSLWEKFSSLLQCPGFNLKHVLATESYSKVVENQLSLSVTDSFLRPVHWLLYVRGLSSHPDTLITLSPHEANRLVMQRLTGRWSPRVSLLMYSTPLRLQQSIMADWSCTVAGERIPRLCKGASHFQQLFAEIFLYSGGLFFGEQAETMIATMESLSTLLQLLPGPHDVSGEQVHFAPHHSQDNLLLTERHTQTASMERAFSSDPVSFLRDLMAILRSTDSLELSHVGCLLLRHSWVTPNSEYLPSSGTSQQSSFDTTKDDGYSIITGMTTSVQVRFRSAFS